MIDLILHFQAGHITVWPLEHSIKRIADRFIRLAGHDIVRHGAKELLLVVVLVELAGLAHPVQLNREVIKIPSTDLGKNLVLEGLATRGHDLPCNLIPFPINFRLLINVSTEHISVLPKQVNDSVVLRDKHIRLAIHRQHPMMLKILSVPRGVLSTPLLAVSLTLRRRETHTGGGIVSLWEGSNGIALTSFCHLLRWDRSPA